MSKPVLSKEKQKDIARERVMELFKQAEQVFAGDKALANRYVKIARDIAMSVKLRLPRELKRRYCKHCYAYLMPGKNCRVRVHLGKVIISCLECKKFMRIPLKS
jgi:ribonuclease P protein subunit RPR2